MATSTPVARVYIAFDSGYATPAASRTWTEVTDWVEGGSPIVINRGRADEINDIDPSTLTLTLDNSDGRFSPGKTGGAYYPDVKKGRPIQVRVTYNSVTFTRFTGYIDTWPVEWPAQNDSYSTVTITATSRMARMARGVELRSIIEEETLVDGPIAYWPLTEADDGTSNQTAANIAGTDVPALQKTRTGTGTVSDDLLFGSQDGPLTDGVDVLAPSWSPVDGSNGYYLKSSPITLTGTTLSIDLWFNATATAREEGMVSLVSADATTYIQLFMTPSGVIYCDVVDGGSGTIDLAIGSGYDDGALHHLSVDLTSGSGSANGTGHMYLDGTLVTTVTDVIPFGLDQYAYINVGAHRYGTYIYDGVIAHLSLYDTVLGSTRVAAHYSAGLTGFAGESSGARIDRLAGYLGLATAEVNTDTGSSTVIMQDTTGATALDLMRDVESTENGALFDGTDGELYFLGRDSRYLTTSDAFTLNCTTQDVGADLAPTFDDQFLRNDVTVSRAETPTGSTVETWRATDTTSVDEYGPYRDTLESLAYTAGEVTDAATWRVAKYAEPIVRIPAVTADLVTADTTLGDLLIDADIGTRFGLSNLPSQAPASTLSVFIEGYQETITATSYEIAFYVTPASLSEVWILQDATYGVYDDYPLAF